MVEVPTQHHKRPPFWRNVNVLKWAAQLIVLVTVFFVGWIVYSEASSNIKAKGISASFDFLADPPGIAIAEGIDTRPATGARALLVGIVNMLRVTVAGIIAATLLGVLIGVARLSHNWIVNKIATVYIETIRNIPLLVQIIFFEAVIISFPNLELDSGPITGWFYASNKGISFFWFFPSEGFYQWATIVFIGIVLSVFVYRRRKAIKLETGRETYPVLSAQGVVLAFAVVGWFIHPVMGFLGPILNFIADLIDAIPTAAVQVALAVLAVFLAARWIKKFLDNLRTPAGLAKLTDDDYFRVGSAALIGLIAAAFFLLQAGVSDWVVQSGRDFFNFLGDKYEWLGTGQPIDFRRPNVVQPGNFPNFGTNGMTMTKLFFPVFVGVTLYTAAFIAEIVRGGILAVAKGQSEAGLALGLRRSQLLRLIILPQALRIILPPMGNQYLNLAKNTSLGIAVAYPEVVSVGQTLYNQTGQTVPVVILWMAFYLSVSLTLSAVVNYYNRKLKLVER